MATHSVANATFTFSSVHSSNVSQVALPEFLDSFHRKLSVHFSTVGFRDACQCVAAQRSGNLDTELCTSTGRCQVSRALSISLRRVS